MHKICMRQYQEGISNGTNSMQPRTSLSTSCSLLEEEEGTGRLLASSGTGLK